MRATFGLSLSPDTSQTINLIGDWTGQIKSRYKINLKSWLERSLTRRQRNRPSSSNRESCRTEDFSSLFIFHRLKVFPMLSTFEIFQTGMPIREWETSVFVNNKKPIKVIYYSVLPLRECLWLFAGINIWKANTSLEGASECDGQCDQIGRFIGLWATFQSL